MPISNFVDVLRSERREKSETFMKVTWDFLFLRMMSAYQVLVLLCKDLVSLFVVAGVEQLFSAEVLSGYFLAVLLAIFVVLWR